MNGSIHILRENVLLRSRKRKWFGQRRYEYLLMDLVDELFSSVVCSKHLIEYNQNFVGQDTQLCKTKSISRKLVVYRIK